PLDDAAAAHVAARAAAHETALPIATIAAHRAGCAPRAHVANLAVHRDRTPVHRPAEFVPDVATGFTAFHAASPALCLHRGSRGEHKRGRRENDHWAHGRILLRG